MSLYYLDDYSLGEIAEEFDVSRQAVYDNIKRTEAMLEEYEQKLRLYEKFKQRKKIISKLKSFAFDNETKKHEFQACIESLEKLD